MKTNIAAFIKQASPVELFTLARQLANCNGLCPAQCKESEENCRMEYPYQCAMHFKKWALKQAK
jgi:hypothetical protein